MVLQCRRRAEDCKDYVTTKKNKVMKWIFEVLDLEKWEQWLYLAILPAGFVVAALCGSLVGRL